jgi:hypothetical protein
MYYGSTPFQVSHDAVQAPQELHVCEGPYTEQLVPIEGWYYKVGATINGTHHTLDPRIYNQGETGGGQIPPA